MNSIRSSTLPQAAACFMVAILAFLVLFLTGCQTTGTAPSITPAKVHQVVDITPAKVHQVVDEGVGVFTALRLKNKPESRAVFVRVKDALDNLVLHETWSLSAFHEALIAADVAAVTTSDMALYITPGISIVQLFVQGANVDLAQVEFARAVVVGADAGITRALLIRPSVEGNK